MNFFLNILLSNPKQIAQLHTYRKNIPLVGINGLRYIFLAYNCGRSIYIDSIGMINTFLNIIPYI